MNPKIDACLSEATQWREELGQLRKIALGCQLTKELKWGKPCYSFRESNVVILQGFKGYCALMFCKGVLLKDAKNLLVKPGEHTQAGRQLRFTNVREITKMASTVKAYVEEPVAVEKAGLQVSFKKNPEPVPEELKTKLAANPALKTAFAALTPGRQRACILYFSAARQSKTRESRIEKCVGQIL